VQLPRQLISSRRHDRLDNPGERVLAGRVSGLLWLTGAVTLLLTLPLPGSDVQPLGVVVLVAAFAVAWGAAMLLAVASDRATVRLAHVSTLLGLIVVATLAPATGGVDSPTGDYLWFVLVYAAFFFTPRQALGYGLACGLVHALPLLYDRGAVGANLARELVVVGPIYCLLGGVVVAGRELMTGLLRETGELEAKQHRVADEQSSLRRVATAVAAGSPPAAIFTLVSSEAGRLLSADDAAIVRYRDPDQVVVLGRWTSGARERLDPGTVRELAREGLLDRLRAGDPVARDEAGDRPRHTRLAAPVHTGTAPWGALVVAAREPHDFGVGGEERLQEYADLIAVALANAEDRARLDSEAATDQLTGLPNHRAFRERLVEEVARARRHGRALTVAVIDIDGFRELNERAGLQAADAVLADVGRRLRHVLREEDVLARMGGDEYGVIFAESDRHQALLIADRARRAVAEAPLRHRLRATVSVGLCDLDVAWSDDELLRRADAALFWAKQHGPDLCWLYDPAVVHELDERHRTRELDRSHALIGLRALARAIDAKDPDTQEHSERVAVLAARLAAARGWTAERVTLLRDAALLHDVGKIGVPDAILLKPGELDEAELAIVREHPTLGARIVGDVLEQEQVAWIASHHERPDGRGYPLGLLGDAVPEGAALLALADAWDVMVSERSYRPAMAMAEALAQARAAAGTQFDVGAVAALETLARRGELTRAAARMHQPTT
jgi:diguanylate cyclase (GGDEF)-like protein/putative nucleotidyltransferase with HDIG domain